MVPACVLQAVKVPWGMRERANEVHALIAGQRAHGAAGIFYTCAPDDVHQPLAVRRSTVYRAAKVHRDEQGVLLRDDVFPKSKEDAFERALRGQTPDERVTNSDLEEGRKHRMDEATLQRLAAANPIASALVFDHLAENVRTSLFGQSLERPCNLTLRNNCLDGTDGIEGTALHRKKGVFGTCFLDGTDGIEGTALHRKKGVFGTCFLNRDVKECNKRAAMHEVSAPPHDGRSPPLP